MEEIINGVLTYDERLKIGRRIEIAQMLELRLTYKEISETLKVGLSTISLVDKLIKEHPKCYQLIKDREEEVEETYKSKAYEKSGGPKMVLKRKQYTVFKRKDVRR